MARKAVKKKASADGRFSEKFSGDYAFVKHDMTREEKTAYRAFDWTGLDLLDCIEKRVQENYKVSMAYDDYHHCAMASLTCRAVDVENSGLILTARAATAWEALQLLIYKDRVLLLGDWTAWHERDADESDNWG